LSIKELEELGSWGQFMYIIFYTATDLSSAESQLIKSGVLPGNKFAGQLLIKVEREITKNPKPLEKKTILSINSPAAKGTPSQRYLL